MLAVESPSKLMAQQLRKCTLEDVQLENDVREVITEPEIVQVKLSPQKRERPNTRSRKKNSTIHEPDLKNVDSKNFSMTEAGVDVCREIENTVKISPKKKVKESEDDNSQRVCSSTAVKRNLKLSIGSSEDTVDQVADEKPDSKQENVGSTGSSVSLGDKEKPFPDKLKLKSSENPSVQREEETSIRSQSKVEMLPENENEANAQVEKSGENELMSRLNGKLNYKPRRSQSVDATKVTSRSTKTAKHNKSNETKSKKTDKKRATSQENRIKDSNWRVTDFYQYRRSDRRLGVKKPTKEEIYEQLLLENCQDGLKVQVFEGKGRGIVATKRFERNDFVVEYRGEVITPAEAKLREEKFENNPDVGCYMYYFVLGNTRYCVDATKELDSYGFGRLLNHSRKNANCRTKALSVRGEPRLILLANRSIEEGEELLYDYGDRSKTALLNHPWLAL